MKFYFYILLINVCFSATFCCQQHKTCNECIKDENKCVWCADKNYTENVRCKPEMGVGDWCSGHIQNPNHRPKSEVKRDDEFSSKKGGIIQLKPQQIKLKLRPGQEVDFNFTYKRASDYPLDFYFLIDASESMKSYASNISANTKAMYKMLNTMTNDIVVGMGSFVDKNAMPYAQDIQANLSFSFKNLLSMNMKYENFESTLKNMKFGTNLDEPEAALDALAQVMACKDEIGWRKQSRKIIVVNTDATYHIAGHGLLAGIIRPYDGNCHLKNNMYTMELEMDYPSISILKYMASTDSFVVIFVVESKVYNDYEPLVEKMGAYVTSYTKRETVKADELLKDIYNSITESIKLTSRIDSQYADYFSITFKPDCDNQECRVNINEKKKFVGTVKLLKYLDAESVPIDVTIEGLSEKVHLDVNIIKDCDCTPKSSSDYCHGHGTETCAICECDQEWQGDYCQCLAGEGLNIEKERCIVNGTECSNRGVCECGKCKCTDKFNGQFCECNKQNCMRGSNGKVCSGNGRCSEVECEKCKCDDNWIGNDCSCQNLQTKCKEDGKEICSGLGKCKCNKCTCVPPDPWDVRSRDYLCRPQLGVATDATRQQQCGQLNACVLQFLNGMSSSCQNINITAVDTLDIEDTAQDTSHDTDMSAPQNMIDMDNDAEDIAQDSEIVESQEVDIKHAKAQETSNIIWIECPAFRAEAGCYTKFVYAYNDTSYGVDIKVQAKLNCAETYYWAGGGCLIGLILIGLVTLVCWKLLTDRRDRAEYDRFFKEVQSENPELINPIFAPAVVSFSNPAFEKTRKDAQ